MAVQAVMDQDRTDFRLEKIGLWIRSVGRFHHRGKAKYHEGYGREFHGPEGGRGLRITSLNDG